MNLEIPLTDRDPDQFSMERSLVFIGPNGSGKSSVLRAIARTLRDRVPRPEVCSVEGGRAIKLPATMEVEVKEYNRLGKPTALLGSIASSREQTLSDRLLQSLLLLEHRHTVDSNQHSRSLNDWHAAGKLGEPPEQLLTQLDDLIAVFTVLFPHMQIHWDFRSKKVLVKKEGNPDYPFAHLSDGEKQVFSILADIISLVTPPTIFIVDEPELNLNPSIASRLWDVIENRFPTAHFIYATHSVAFAMRSSIEQIIALSAVTNRAEVLSSVEDIASDELKLLLGAVPLALSTRQILFAEGNEASFDVQFYRWLLKDIDHRVLHVGDCHQVQSAARGQGFWDDISLPVQTAGVIDRDLCGVTNQTTADTAEEVSDSPENDGTLSDEMVIDGEAAIDDGLIVTANIVTLHFNEAESYLCLPELIVALATHVGSVDPLPTVDSITDEIITYAETHIIRRVAAITNESLRIGLAAGVTRAESSGAADIDALVDNFVQACHTELAKATELLNRESVQSKLIETNDSIREHIDERNVPRLLALLEGKSLYKHLARLSGLSNPQHFERSVFKNLSADDFLQTKMLKDKLVQLLQIEAEHIS